MKILIDKSFVNDVDKIKDVKLLRTLNKIITELEKSDSLAGLPKVKKN